MSLAWSSIRACLVVLASGWVLVLDPRVSFAAAPEVVRSSAVAPPTAAKPATTAKPATATAAKPATAVTPATASTKVTGTAAGPTGSPGTGAAKEATTTAAAAGGGAPAAAPRRESDVYGERLDALKADVDQLKDRIFRSKARLTLLKETVLRGALAGGRVVLAHRNLMGASFRLTKVAYLVDGAQVYARSEMAAGLDQESELIVFDGHLAAGPHELTIELSYKGRGLGVFSYLNAYTFDARSTHTITVADDGAMKVVSLGYERGNVTTEMKDRPSVDWQLVPIDTLGRPLPADARPRGGAATLQGSAAQGR